MNLCKKLAPALILFAMMVGTYSYAGEVILPVITSPAALSEGTQTLLTKDQVAELTPWATDSKISLQDLLDNLEGLSSSDKVDHITSEIKDILNKSANKKSELFMRYSLTRALVLMDILNKEMGLNDVGGDDLKNRLLVSSVKMAIKYYDTDMMFLNRKQQASFAMFGVEYFNFLTYLNKSIIDSAAQYTIQKLSLEWLQWDLYRDIDNTKYASEIVRINSFLATLPSGTVSGKDALNLIKQMKKLASKLDVVTKFENQTEEMLAIKTQLRIEEFTYTQFEENGSAVSAFLGAGSLVEVVNKDEVQLYDYYVDVKVISNTNTDTQYKSAPVGSIAKVPYVKLKPLTGNTLARFGQTFTSLYNTLLVKSNCGTVKMLGYRDVAFIGEGSTIQVLDPKPIHYSSRLFVIMDPNFVKVRILNAKIGDPNRDAKTGCVGYIGVDMIRPDF